MPEVMTKKGTIDEIVKEARKLDKLELQAILARIRVKKLQKGGVKPIAGYDNKKVKSPTLTQIDKWKHQSRKPNAH